MSFRLRQHGVTENWTKHDLHTLKTFLPFICLSVFKSVYVFVGTVSYMCVQILTITKKLVNYNQHFYEV